MPLALTRGAYPLSTPALVRRGGFFPPRISPVGRSVGLLENINLMCEARALCAGIQLRETRVIKLRLGSNTTIQAVHSISMLAYLYMCCVDIHDLRYTVSPACERSNSRRQVSSQKKGKKRERERENLHSSSHLPRDASGEDLLSPLPSHRPLRRLPSDFSPLRFYVRSHLIIS